MHEVWRLRNLLMRVIMQFMWNCSAAGSLASQLRKSHLPTNSAVRASRGLWCSASNATPVPKTKLTGQVTSKEANFVKVRLDHNLEAGISEPTDLLCSVRALLKKIKQTVLVGDNVEVDAVDWADKRGVVYEVSKRHSEMSDPAMANVDQIVIVMSLDRPPFDAMQATRFLVSAEIAEIPAVVLLNKADLLEDESTQALVAEVSHWGYKAIPVSVASGQGMLEVAEALDGRISAVAGPSGVGKSSIINALRLRAQQAQQAQQAQDTQQAQRAQHAQQAQHAGDTQQAQRAQHGSKHSTATASNSAHSQSEHSALPHQSSKADDAAGLDQSAATQHASSGSQMSSAPDVQADVVHRDEGSHASTSYSSQPQSHQHQHHVTDKKEHWNRDAASSQHAIDNEQHSNTEAAPSKFAQPIAASDALLEGKSPASDTATAPDLSSPPNNHSQASHTPHHASSSASPGNPKPRGEAEGAQPSGHSGPTGVDRNRGGPEGLQGGLQGGLQLQSVGDMSNIGRGMHTTRHVALLEVGKGLLADTPGFNVPSLTNLTVGNLQACFPEIERRLEEDRCTFSNCQHVQEPGCCVRQDFTRHSIYVELYQEVKHNEDLERHRSMSKKRRQGTVRYKTKAGGGQTREALLESKKHRNVNRRQTRQGMQGLIDQVDEDDDDHDKMNEEELKALQ